MNCTHQNDQGALCQAKAMTGEPYCFFHSPKEEHERQRQEAQSRGGKANAVTVGEPLPPLELKGARDVVLLLEDTINRVRDGTLDVRIGNCIGMLAGQLIKALEVTSIANRVEIIERAIVERRISS